MRWFDSYFQKSAIYTSDRCGKSKGVIYVKTRLRRSNTHFEGASFKLAIANAIETVTTEWLRLWNTWVMSRNMTRKCKRIPFFRRLLWRVGLFGGLQHCYFSPSEAFGSPWQSCQSTCSVWHLLNPPNIITIQMQGGYSRSQWSRLLLNPKLHLFRHPDRPLTLLGRHQGFKACPHTGRKLFKATRITTAIITVIISILGRASCHNLHLRSKIG